MLAPALDTVRLTLHVLAATVWVGGQIVMMGLVGPARGLGADAPKTLARAFARLAWPAYAVLVVTGIWNITAVHCSDQDSAWKAVLMAKIAVVAPGRPGRLPAPAGHAPRASWPCGARSGAWPAWRHWSWASCWPGDSEQPCTATVGVREPRAWEWV